MTPIKDVTIVIPLAIVNYSFNMKLANMAVQNGVVLKTVVAIDKGRQLIEAAQKNVQIKPAKTLVIN